MSKNNIKIIAITLVMLLTSSSAFPAANLQATESKPKYKPVSLNLPLTATAGGDFVIEGTNEGVACRDATTEESQALTGRDETLPLHVITPVSDEVSTQGGLSIILRGTPQLENFPQAKSAFLKAAQTWEAVIQTAITLIIDVDYGPNRFGVPYPNPNILGSTSAQNIGSSTLYPSVRNGLISTASSPAETGLYNALPNGNIPTDIGSTAAMIAPSAVFRALGIVGAVADPASETANFGPPPAIGFNSSFQFDFDPSNGIDPGKTDFDAVAVHELGHALGCVSNVGFTELIPGAQLAPSVFDLLRFRPGVTQATFPTAFRIMSSGGTQVFFAGGSQLQLSTGRGDASGGDGQQASHWKADEQTGQYIGIMDPTLSAGQRKTLTDNDLLLFNSIGYQVANSGGSGGDTIPLSSGVSKPGSIPAPPNEGSAVLAAAQYTVQVPSGTTQLTVELSGNQDVDLYVRAGQRVTISSSGPQADFVSDSPNSVESVTISPSSSPPLLVGTYYIAVANFGPGAASFNLKATITGGGGGGGNRSPETISVQAVLDGDELTLTGVVEDPDGDIVQAQSGLLDGTGQVVGSTAPFGVNFGSSTRVNFTLSVSNMSAIPAAVFASLTFIDRRGNKSDAKVADFGKADQGGPSVLNASYNGSKLVIKGNSFASQLLIEINGRVLGIAASASDKKIKIKGSPDRLNLRNGPNRIQVYNGSLRSNLFVLSL